MSQQPDTLQQILNACGIKQEEPEMDIMHLMQADDWTSPRPESKKMEGSDGGQCNVWARRIRMPYLWTQLQESQEVSGALGQRTQRHDTQVRGVWGQLQLMAAAGASQAVSSFRRETMKDADLYKGKR